ncbi:MAG: hypothetical protein JWP58_3425 [Hymenobacter sp.]|nr:hypothetical protein [Hymenobacter sp.]
MKRYLLAALTTCAALTEAPVAFAQTVCPAGPAAVVLNAQTITTNTTWTRNNIYLLNGFVYVENGATLTIESGTIIKGDLANKGALIIKAGARIIAIGTPTQPIVFTSNQPAGSRGPGDWGGVVLVGNAPTNNPAQTQVEGGVNAFYGGPTANNPADNSGVMQYVRIEFPGVAFLPNSEINGLTMCGVGSGTTIDHIQVTGSGDDSFEWFGGSVNCKYLIAQAGTDDDFDTDNGFSGRVQFGLAVRNPNRGDNASGGESNGFESDNDATGTANTPKTSAVFSNMTVLLPTATTPASPFNTGSSALIRRNSAQSIFNSVLAGRPYGLTLNSNSANLTTANAAAGTLSFENNVVATMGTYSRRAARVTSNAGATAGFSPNAFVSAAGNDTTRTFASLGLSADYLNYDGNCSSNRQCTPTFTLPAGSFLTTGGTFSNAKLTSAGTGVNGTFDVVTFRGAFGPAGTAQGSWADGWTNFNPQITCYNVAGQTLANREVANAPLQALTVSPNPTDGTAATLGFDVKTATTATVRVVDLMGRQVAVVLNGGKLSAGPQRLLLPATLAPGMYVATVTTGEIVQSVRFVVAK